METKWYVNIYRVSRAFGGHEEGGWYYDAGTFIREAGRTDNEGSAHELRGQILEAIENVGHYNDAVIEPSSVREGLKGSPFGLKRNQMGMGPYDGADPNGEGDDNYLIKGGKWGDEKIRVHVQNHKGRDYPQEQPFYE